VKGEAKVWEAASLDVTRAALEAFAKAAAGGPAYPVTLEQAIHGVAATEAIIRSAASGKVEQVA
jgi:predicted dehydrogenase